MIFLQAQLIQHRNGDYADTWLKTWSIFFLHSSSMQILPASNPKKYINSIPGNPQNFRKGLPSFQKLKRKVTLLSIVHSLRDHQSNPQQSLVRPSVASGDFIQVAASNGRRLKKEERSSRRTKVHQRRFKSCSNYFTRCQST